MVQEVAEFVAGRERMRRLAPIRHIPQTGEKISLTARKFNETLPLFCDPLRMRSTLPFAEQAPALTGWQVAGKLTRTFVTWMVAFGSVIAVGYLLR